MEAETPNAEESAGLLRERLPYHALIAAILWQAVLDSRGKVHSNARQAARAFLTDEAAIIYFCELAGCDGSQVHPALLRAAGLQA